MRPGQTGFIGARRLRRCLPLLSLVLSCSLLAGSRIVTLSPHAAELVAAAGAAEAIVGISAFTSGAEFEAVPVIADSRGLDRERALALAPDLAVVWRGGNKPTDIRWLKNQGIEIFSSAPETIDDIPAEIRRLGKLTGTAIQANQEADRLDSRIAAIRQQFEQAPVKDYYFQLWRRPPMTLGSKSLISRALKDCGAKNVFEQVPRESFMPDPEALAAVKADVEIVPGDGSAIQQITSANRVLSPDMNSLYTPGPDFLAAWEKLCEEVHSAR